MEGLQSECDVNIWEDEVFNVFAAPEPSSARRTPLIFACQRNNTAMALLLLDLGADMNQKSNDVCVLKCPQLESLIFSQFAQQWLTPLHHACLSGSYEVAVLLVDRGADINAATYVWL